MQIQSQNTEPDATAARARVAGPVDEGSNHGHLETTPIGEHSWRVSDMSVPEEDPQHVVAFVEATPHDVEIVWTRGARTAPGRFGDLERALDAIDDVITTGEARDSA
jgi:hypothetical protein